MKKLFIILTIVALGNLSAQSISKAEKKALLAEINEFKKSPEKLKALKESIEVRDVIINQGNEEIAALKKKIQLNSLNTKELQDSLDYLSSHAFNKSTHSTNSSYNFSSTTTNAPVNHSGTKYRVQIGLFNSFNIENILAEPKYLVHENVNGMHRYSIANFNTEAEAETFKKEMRKMGIKDAFVTTYNEGYRTGDVKPVQKSVVVTPTVTPPVKVERNGFNVKPSNNTTSPNVEVSTPTTKPNTSKSTETEVIGTQIIESRPVTIEPKENEIKTEGDGFLFRDDKTNTKSNGIKIHVAE